jgi:tetratricopeptide (TPR) repeat protein
MARRLRIATLLIAAAVLPSVGAQETPVGARDWIEARSENFRIYSVLGEERTTELLRHLEIMRATLGDAGEESTYEAGVPTIIVAVDNRDDYVLIGAPAYSGGYFFSDLRENAILIEDSSDTEGIQVILHEYAHYLSRRSGRIRYPRWYEEGNAEYLSHSRLRDNAFEFAIAPREYVTTLGFGTWMPVAELLQVSDAASLAEIDAPMFYAQSWLLVHYLNTHAESDTSVAQQLIDYTSHTATGLPPAEAFARAFGVEPEALDQELLRYFLERKFERRLVLTNTALPGFSTLIRAMSSTEAQLALAQMALRFENIDGAERWFEEALSDSDLRALAEAGLGRVAGYRGDIEAANARFESAIFLMAWDFTIWMDYAQYWAQRVSASYSADERIRYASRLIDSLESALTISDATPELNSLMGFAYLARGRDPHEAIEYLELAAADAPHDQASRLLLANAYLYVGRLDDAVRVAESVMRFEHEPGLITSAALEVIEDANARR